MGLRAEMKFRLFGKRSDSGAVGGSVVTNKPVSVELLSLDEPWEATVTYDKEGGGKEEKVETLPAGTLAVKKEPGDLIELLATGGRLPAAQAADHFKGRRIVAAPKVNHRRICLVLDDFASEHEGELALACGDLVYTDAMTQEVVIWVQSQ